MKPYHYTESGLDNVHILGVTSLVDEEGEAGVYIPNFLRLHKSISASVVFSGRTISGAELRYLRTEMGMTQGQLAATVQKDTETIKAWERGETEIDPNDEIAIRKLAIERLLLG